MNVGNPMLTCLKKKFVSYFVMYTSLGPYSYLVSIDQLNSTHIIIVQNYTKKMELNLSKMECFSLNSILLLNFYSYNLIHPKVTITI